MTRTELIKTFTEIDEKINDLHVRSSADFMQLNVYLKDYYKQTNIISGNAFKILETIAGKRNIDLIEELGIIHQRLEECRNEIKENDTCKIQVLKELATKSNQLNIALRNTKQDLTTFKFLLSNYNLISNYEGSDKKIPEDPEKLDLQIQSVNASLISAGTVIDRFREQIVYSIDQLEFKIERSLKIFLSLSREIKSNIGLVIQKNQDSKTDFPVLKEKTADSSESINNIITHLQYQDIIRQKIEHIQLSHSTIINDLKESVSNMNDTLNSDPEDLQKIGDIAGLQSAQLLMVSKEYQKALEIITKNFQAIGEDLTIISNISSDFSYKDNNSEITLLKQIRNQLDEGIILLDMNNFVGLNNKYRIAEKKLDDISVFIRKEITEPLKKFRKFETLSRDNFEDQINKPSILHQISMLANDIAVKNQDICNRIKELINLASKLNSFDNLESWGTQLEKDRINLMVNISRILDALDKDNQDLDDVLNQNSDLNNYILEKIGNVINKTDYYNYFENIVEEVIGQLNSINYRLRKDCSDETAEERARNLQDIKISYTMEAERIVHDKVVSGCDNPEVSVASGQDDDVEFF